jgi:hypothetical protein
MLERIGYGHTYSCLSINIPATLVLSTRSARKEALPRATASRENQQPFLGNQAHHNAADRLRTHRSQASSQPETNKGSASIKNVCGKGKQTCFQQYRGGRRVTVPPLSLSCSSSIPSRGLLRLGRTLWSRNSQLNSSSNRLAGGARLGPNATGGGGGSAGGGGTLSLGSAFEHGSLLFLQQGLHLTNVGSLRPSMVHGRAAGRPAMAGANSEDLAVGCTKLGRQNI